jgi:hypothetical protein
VTEQSPSTTPSTSTTIIRRWGTPAEPAQACLLGWSERGKGARPCLLGWLAGKVGLMPPYRDGGKRAAEPARLLAIPAQDRDNDDRACAGMGAPGWAIFFLRDGQTLGAEIGSGASARSHPRRHAWAPPAWTSTPRTTTCMPPPTATASPTTRSHDFEDDDRNHAFDTTSVCMSRATNQPWYILFEVSILCKYSIAYYRWGSRHSLLCVSCIRVWPSAVLRIKSNYHHLRWGPFLGV